mgnify:CR=1 FL=1
MLTIFEKIDEKIFHDDEFLKLSKDTNNIKTINTKNNNDYEIFDPVTLKLLYTLPKESFSLVTGETNKVFLTKIKNILSIDRFDIQNKFFCGQRQNRTADPLFFSHVQIGIRTGQDTALQTKMCRRDQERSPATEIFAQIRTRLRSAVPPSTSGPLDRR